MKDINCRARLDTKCDLACNHRAMGPVVLTLFMIEADAVFMRRALELARRGAGRVSPNPMVGALLVQDGSVVGEGFHRYDLLKHGETYALEIAGALARGATLYCNLEPCCHHGRTPPCTDALIEAGIARAIIATKDTYAKVNGRGIEQLRAAGIEVDVGLLEVEAIRLNEAYFKFVTRDAPFVHGVIEYPGDKPWTAAAWQPSNEFVEMAREYDAMILGSRPELNTELMAKRLSEEHHRPLIVVGGERVVAEQDHTLNERSREELIVIPLSPRRRELRLAPSHPSERRREAGSSDNAGEGPEPPNLPTAAPEIGSVLSTLAKMNVTSVLLLPGEFDPSDPNNFGQLDKVTLAAPGPKVNRTTATRLAFADLEFDLEEVSVVETEGYTEFTGYPSLRGVA